MNSITRFRSGRNLMSQLHEDFNRLLAPFELGRGDLSLPEFTIGDWFVTLDVKEDDTKYTVRADVPGVRATDIDISMENGILTIKGKRKFEVEETKGNFLRIERSAGSFIRQLTLPQTVNQEKIEAKCQDGVLEITLPKQEEGIGRKIQVKQAE